MEDGAPVQKRARKQQFDQVHSLDSLREDDDDKIQCPVQKNPSISHNILLKHGQNALQWLLGEKITVDKFLSEYWGKKPLIAKRTSTSLSYCGDNFLSLSKVHEACQNHSLTQPSDYITCKYVNGKRQNCNFDRKILMNQATGKNVSIAPQIDAAVKNGCTIQFFQPQRYSDPLWDLQSNLETFFGCLVGASSYLTPPQTQGLAPHHDDVDVFILQTEGRKRWRLYKNVQKWPRFPTADIPRNMIGEPTMEFILEQGDLLYMPRGVVHEAIAEDVFSTHVTISTYQRYTYVDFLKQMIPSYLEKLSDFLPVCGGENVSANLREGLPLQSIYHYGHVAGDKEQEKLQEEEEEQEQEQEIEKQKQNSIGVKSSSISAVREGFVKRLQHLLHSAADSLQGHCIDAAMEEWVLDFLKHRLPPFPDLKSRFTNSSDSGGNDEGVATVKRSSLISISNQRISSSLESAFFKYPVRLRQPHLIRLQVREDNSIVLHHPFENSRRLHMSNLQQFYASETKSDFITGPPSEEENTNDDKGGESATVLTNSKTISDSSISSKSNNSSSVDSINGSNNSTFKVESNAAPNDYCNDDEDCVFSLVHTDNNDDDAESADADTQSSSDDEDLGIGAVLLPSEGMLFVRSLLDQGDKFTNFNSQTELVQLILRSLWETDLLEIQVPDEVFTISKESSKSISKNKNR